MQKNPKPNQASIKFIFFTVVLDMIGIGILIPIFPDVIRRFGTDPSFVNVHFGFFVSVFALMQFLASPLLGALSDQFGRRPILLASILGAGLDYLLMAFAPTLSVLYLGRIFAGLTSANMTVASSYIADITPENERAAKFGIIGAAFGIGFIAGPMLGGVLGQFGYHVPFLVAAFLNFLNLLFGYFVLPESLPPEQRRRLQFQKLNPVSSLNKIFRYQGIVWLLILHGLAFLAGMVHPAVWTLFTEYKFGWDSKMVGFSLSAVGLAVAIVQGGLTKWFTKKFGDMGSLKIGLILGALASFGFALVPEGWMVFLVIIPSALSGLAGPALQSQISQKAPPSEQGELQGTLTSIGSLMAIIAPLLYTNIFDFFVGPKSPRNFPGAPYILAGIILLSGFFIALSFKSKPMKL